MPSRRGFIGAMFTGAVAIAASKVASIASASTESVEKATDKDDAAFPECEDLAPMTMAKLVGSYDIGNWRLYSERHTDISVDELVEKMRKAYSKTVFNSPDPPKELTFRGKPFVWLPMNNTQANTGYTP